MNTHRFFGGVVFGDGEHLQLARFDFEGSESRLGTEREESNVENVSR